MYSSSALGIGLLSAYLLVFELLLTFTTSPEGVP
jgi:hypothetical protein